ncbi:uncharacterized protein LOC128654499 [Bombina bombina]|uniref:uncharacterized protein LOC128654499 n=1 Tax=Bombina bombina TaxID=8345 RepID=UPI00235B281C|nr:uncharacterized protein LOC128654499 [Bombina bombina]XP_053564430.1 uncharacterized protein LOC128654499 [Bombina bombina]
MKNPCKYRHKNPNLVKTYQSPNFLQNLPSKQDIVRSCIREELEELKQDIHMLGFKFETLESNQDIIKEDVNQLTEQLTSQQETILSFQDKLDDLENQSRCKNMLIRGVPESVLPRDFPVYLQDLFHHLKDHSYTDDIPWIRAHRTLRPKPPYSAPPRDIVIHLKKFQEKEMILNQACKNKPVRFRGNVLQFFQDLSTHTLQRRKEFLPLTTLLRNKRIL